MSTRLTLLGMPQELILMIFIQVYSAAQIDFSKGLDLEKHKSNETQTWVPEEYILPMLICKFLNPFALEAFLRQALFIVPSIGLGTKRYSWLAAKSFRDPTDLARRVRTDLLLAHSLTTTWLTSRDWYPNLKDLTITGQITNFRRWGPGYYCPDLDDILSLRLKCFNSGIKFTTYLTLRSRRIANTRQYAQYIRLVIRGDGSVAIKEVKKAEKAFYDLVKQMVKAKLGQDLVDMECGGRRKTIKYVDSKLDWQ